MRVIVNKSELPTFASEEEEANWYPAHPEFVTALFERAEAEGRLVRGPVVKRLDLTSPVTLRISQGDLEKAKAQAETKGVGYQTYMAMLLREALLKVESEGSGAKSAAA
jgi:uncharacterized protein (DUF4415 family)